MRQPKSPDLRPGYPGQVNRPTILLDCDPGHDDAIALAVAGAFTRLIGVTTVSGNAPLEKTTRNALLTCQLLGLEVAIHAGASRPLIAEPRHAEFIHGASGLDGPALPPLTREPAGSDAAGFIVESASNHSDLWLVATGPLTNVAAALLRDPKLADRLAGIAIMGGGSTFGNVTAAAEFNILSDPEAADRVFRSGANLVLADLNLTHQFRLGESHIDRIRRLRGPVPTFVADLLTFYSTAYSRAYSGRVEGPLHDPTAVLALSHPELFERERRHAVIELRGDHTRGMTVVDSRGGHRGEEANLDLLTRIDAEAAFEVLLAAIHSYRGGS